MSASYWLLFDYLAYIFNLACISASKKYRKLLITILVLRTPFLLLSILSELN